MVHLSQTRRALIWSVLAVIAALLCLLAFRGYLSGDMLLNFANTFLC
jgi:VIT1/CCC1 family predicted Fe2+/Mn2+ transporter